MDAVDRFEEFFREFYEKELLTIASNNKKSLNIDFSLLDKFDPDLADKLLNDPTSILEQAANALKNNGIVEIEKLEPRFFNLPHQTEVRIRNLRSEHIGKFISIDGIVKRASEVKPEVSIATYKCPDCGHSMNIIQTDTFMKEPAVCECGRKGKFEITERKLSNVRVLVLEEPFEIATGDRPGSITVFLREDLTTPEMQRKTDPGSRLTVNGNVKELHRFIKGRLKRQMDIFMEANFVESTEIEWEEVLISDEDEKRIKDLAANPDIYNILVKSIAPSMFGMEEVKKAITLQLFGGVRRKLPDGTMLRGDIHLLLVGDPALGKTQLLKLVSKIIPRGRYVSGKGVTGVGLTASVVKDEELMGGWVLEAGAMVLCHKGIIAIDEFDKMHKDDQIAMHEAMSTQTISIAKASIVATLPAETTVLAGANPKYGRFDQYKAISEQIDIPDTLLSRFDLKFVLRDVPNREIDEKMAVYMIESRTKPEKIKPLVEPEFVRKYIAYARHNCSPELTLEAAEILKNFYVEMRNMYQGEDSSAIAITLRQYEALIRLSESSAKIRLSKTVDIEDAKRAIEIMKFSLQQIGYDYETGKMDIDRTEGMPSSKRNKVFIILDIIDKLTREIGKEIPREEIIASAEDQGIKEAEVEEILQKLEREGTIFKPKHDYIKKV